MSSKPRNILMQAAFGCFMKQRRRPNVYFFAGLLALYGLVGATLEQFAILTFLFLLTIALEALNTAVEVLVDHLTNDFAEFCPSGPRIWDPFAVFCGLTMLSLYSLYVVYSQL